MGGVCLGTGCPDYEPAPEEGGVNSEDHEADAI